MVSIAGMQLQGYGPAAGDTRLSGRSCPSSTWQHLALSAAFTTATAAKPATRMFADVPNHRTRRLRGPSSG